MKILRFNFKTQNIFNLKCNCICIIVCCLLLNAFTGAGHFYRWKNPWGVAKGWLIRILKLDFATVTDWIELGESATNQIRNSRMWKKQKHGWFQQILYIKNTYLNFKIKCYEKYKDSLYLLNWKFSFIMMVIGQRKGPNITIMSSRSVCKTIIW